MNKISCIICAYNEEKRIWLVLNALKDHPDISEVIVVNDGSTDDTTNIVEQYDFVKLISFEKNQGKSKAMSAGINAAQNDILMFLDADILTITPTEISELAKPVLENKADVTFSLRKNSLWIYRQLGLDFVSGERVIAKKYFDNQTEEMSSLPGFGVEVFMNRIIIKNKLRLQSIDWKNVLVARKSAKLGFWMGFKGELKMIRQIHKVASFKEMLTQNFELLKLVGKK